MAGELQFGGYYFSIIVILAYCLRLGVMSVIPPNMAMYSLVSNCARRRAWVERSGRNLLARI